jgi:hypothetical protein
MHHGGDSTGTRVTQTCPLVSVRKYSLQMACNLGWIIQSASCPNNCVNSVNSTQFAALDVARSIEKHVAECS